MQARVVTGIVTGLADDGLRLRLAAIMHNHSGSDRAPVGLDTLQSYFDPALFWIEVITEERGRLIHVHDQDIHVSVIVKVSKRATATAVRRADAGAGLRLEFLEDSIAEIAKQDSRGFVRILRQLAL